jgi:hypothetical protein
MDVIGFPDTSSSRITPKSNISILSPSIVLQSHGT